MNTHRRFAASKKLMLVAGIAGLLAGAVGCQSNPRSTNAPGPDAELATWVELMTPRAIEIQPFSQPVSMDGDGSADAIEVIIAARDAIEDPTKVVGTFQFELYERQMASGLKLGERLAYWRVPVSSAGKQKEYWDSYARYYRFALESEPLPAGDYILQAQYTSPTGEHLFDQYVIRYDGTMVPPRQARF
jgi:hypothetical protein